MILAVAALAILDGVQLRPTKARPLSSFPIQVAGSARRLFVNGKATAIVVPSGYEVDVRCHDARGRVGGAILWSTLVSFSFVVEGHGFVTLPRSRARLIPIFARSIDERGRAVGIGGSDSIGDDTPWRGLLWDGRRVLDLGPAEQVRFAKDGTVEGYCVTDGTERTVNLLEARTAYLDEGAERYRPFVWRGGARVDGALLKWPPF